VVNDAFEIVGGTLIMVEEPELPVLVALIVLVSRVLVASTGGGGRTLNCGTFAPMLNPLILSALAFKAGNGQV
jgi:hypothetical protein